MPHKYSYPKPKCFFFKKYPELCDKYLLRDMPSWWDEGVKDFIKLVRKELRYSEHTFWQDIWRPLKSAYLEYNKTNVPHPD